MRSLRDLGLLLRRHFKKWAVYNLLTFAFLFVFYAPYNLFWIRMTSAQFLRWVLTAGIFGSLVNVVGRPYFSRVMKYVDGKFA